MFCRLGGVMSTAGLSVGEDGCVVSFEAVHDQIADAVAVDVVLWRILLKDSIEGVLSRSILISEIERLMSDDDVRIGLDVYAGLVPSYHFSFEEGANPDGNFDSCFPSIFLLFLVICVLHSN
jgi:hypothetical protein